MYFEDFSKGQLFFPEKITVSEAEILNFAGKYDPLPIHIDRKYSAEGPFEGLIASGFHTLSMLWGQWVKMGLYREEVIAGIGIDSLKWLAPVRPGDVLSTEVEIIDLIPSAKPGRGTLVLSLTGTNNRGETVLRMQARGYISRRSISSVLE